MYDDDDFIIKEGKADKPIGYPPKNTFVRKALEKTYISILGAIDLGDFETFLKESADLTYDEAKNKLITQYGTQKDLSEARLKARSEEAEAKMEQAEREVLAEQRTLQDEFAEVEEVARKHLEENLELSRRNRELGKEVERLKAELEKKAVPAALPPGAPPAAPAAPAAPAITPEHGREYREFRKRITEFLTQKEIDEIANEIFDILEHQEVNRLTRKDAEELLAELRNIAQKKSMQELEKRISPPAKRRAVKPREEVPEDMLPARRRREEIAPPFLGISPAQVVYRYTEPDMEKFVSMGEEFVRDFELERVIKYNRLLGFPEHWYTISPFGKRERYGWDMASAMREAVDHLRKFTWKRLIKDFGIPEDYIRAWQQLP